MIPQPWYLYILKCKDNSLYIGISNDVEKRVKKHNLGIGAIYTKSRLPVVLLYQEKYTNKSEARKREIQLKGWSRKKKEWLINLDH